MLTAFCDVGLNIAWTCKQAAVVIAGIEAKLKRRHPHVWGDWQVSSSADVLRNWDGRLNNDSRGAVLWREFLIGFSGDDRSTAGDLYSVPFNASDPVGTPNTIAEKTVTISNNLAAAMMALQSQGWALDIALGDVQYDGRAIDERISIPGGTNLEGAISIVDCCSGSNTFAPRGDPGDNVDGRYFTSNGYPVTFGPSVATFMRSMVCRISPCTRLCSTTSGKEMMRISDSSTAK